MAGSMLDHFARQIPMVVIGHHEPTAERFDTVNSDDRLGGKSAVAALQAAGYTDIAMISPPEHFGTEFDVFRERERGYREAMEASGNADKIRILRCREDAAHTVDDLQVILDAPDRPSALFCWSDLHAIPLLNATHLRGLKVPEELAIIGYDNSPVAKLSAIGLSSFDQSATELGTKAAEALSERISGRSTPKHLVIPPQLKKRASF
jgi:LacI family transcriptional regulator